MTPSAETGHAHGDDARMAAQLLAIGCGKLSGAALRGGDAEVREAWLRLVACGGTEVSDPQRIPLGISDEALSGGLDLVATISSGRTVFRSGILSRVANGAPILISTAERWTPASIARLWAAIDNRVRSSAGSGARPVVVALDGGVGEDERPAPQLLDRLAFLVRLDGLTANVVCQTDECRSAVQSGRASLENVTVDDGMITALLTFGAALGVDCAHVDGFALAAARAHAALMGRSEVTEADIGVAGRLVYAPRATRYPAPRAQSDTDDTRTAPEASSHVGSSHAGASLREDGESNATTSAPADLGERLIEAARAALPEGLLSIEACVSTRTRTNATQGRAYGKARPARNGRRVGVRRGDPRHHGPLDLIATVLAAAPWQRLRARWLDRCAAPTPRRRLLILPSDLRTKTFKHRTSCTTIFAVDASGSAAMTRMAEAKGAVELLLGECYVRRARVGLVAFRGTSAEVLLPPTRSLTRARRSLNGLPGGGSTPLASGIDAARELSLTIRRAGDAALLVLLTDGHANVDRDGRPDRRRAGADALTAARSVRADGIAAVLIDISPRPSERAQDVAREMAARYVALPGADAKWIHGAVRAAGAHFGA